MDETVSSALVGRAGRSIPSASLATKSTDSISSERMSMVGCGRSEEEDVVVMVLEATERDALMGVQRVRLGWAWRWHTIANNSLHQTLLHFKRSSTTFAQPEFPIPSPPTASCTHTP